MADELTWTPAWRIRELIGAGDVSPVEVVDHFLGRIEELDPKLKAFAHLDAAGAREQASAAELAVRRGDDLGPLHGIPTSVKEHIAVAGMPRYAFVLDGAATSESPIAPYDDFGVERLRRAGAVIVGTNTMMGTGGGGGMAGAARVFAGFNWDKEARNPWDTSRVPGWSSSGGAAAAVAGLLPFTIGSDGGGSTRLPAAYSGVVGVHPTAALFPNVDYSAVSAPTGNTIGPLARSVRDAALVTQVMGGPDGRDPFCSQVDPPDVLGRIDAGVDDLRFAWTDDYGCGAIYASEDSPRIIEHVRDAAQGFASLGAAVTPTTEAWEDWPAARAVYTAAYGSPIPGTPTASSAEVRDAFELRGRNWDRFREVFREHDLLLSPTAQRVARTVEEWEAAWTTEGPTYPGGTFANTYTALTAIFNWLRFPAVSVPCGFVDGLPVGLQIVGWPGRDDLVLRAAQAFQTAFPRNERPAVS